MKRLVISLALAVGVAAPASAAALLETRVTIHSTVKLAQRITGSHDQPRFPLVAVFDTHGRMVGHVQTWDDDALAAVRGLLESAGDGVLRRELLADAGLDATSIDGPSVLALSLGTVCEPCTHMSEALRSLQAGRPDVHVHMLSANTSR